jgi:hypothetical protein
LDGSVFCFLFCASVCFRHSSTGPRTLASVQVARKIGSRIGSKIGSRIGSKIGSRIGSKIGSRIGSKIGRKGYPGYEGYGIGDMVDI